MKKEDLKKAINKQTENAFKTFLPETDNSNIVVESLQDAVDKYTNLMEGSTNEEIQYAAHDFKEGWKAKEKQLQSLIDSHKELLSGVKDLKMIIETCYDVEFNLPRINEAIEKANNIINSLKV